MGRAQYRKKGSKQGLGRFIVTEGRTSCGHLYPHPALSLEAYMEKATPNEEE